jgi:hypothetical protein
MSEWSKETALRSVGIAAWVQTPLDPNHLFCKSPIWVLLYLCPVRVEYGAIEYANTHTAFMFTEKKYIQNLSPENPN